MEATAATHAVPGDLAGRPSACWSASARARSPPASCAAARRMAAGLRRGVGGRVRRDAEPRTAPDRGPRARRRDAAPRRAARRRDRHADGPRRGRRGPRLRPPPQRHQDRARQAGAAPLAARRCSARSSTSWSGRAATSTSTSSRGARGAAARRASSGPPRPPTGAATGRRVGIVALSTAVGWLLFPYFAPANLVMVYLLGPCWRRRGSAGGRPSSRRSSASRPSTSSSCLPYLTFAVSDTQYVVTFARDAAAWPRDQHAHRPPPRAGEAARQRERRTARPLRDEPRPRQPAGARRAAPGGGAPHRRGVRAPGRRAPSRTRRGAWSAGRASSRIGAEDGSELAVAQWVHEHDQMAGPAAPPSPARGRSTCRSARRAARSGCSASSRRRARPWRRPSSSSSSRPSPPRPPSRSSAWPSSTRPSRPASSPRRSGSGTRS